MKGKEIYLKYIFIILSILISFLFVQYGHNLWGGIIGLAILVLLALTLSKFDLVHPLTWFTPIYFLYAASVPILVATGEMIYRSRLKETLFLEWVALLTLIIVIGVPEKREYKAIYNEKLQNLYIIVYPVYIVSIILSTVYLGYVFSSGLDSKYTIALDQSGMGILVPFFSIYIISFILLVGHSLVIKKNYPSAFILFNIFYTFLALLVIGERDLILKVILGVLYLSHIFHKKIPRRKFILFGIAILLLIPIFGDLKSAAFESRGAEIEVEKSLISRVLESEFIAASRNLNVLLNGQDKWDYFLGETFLWDIQVAFFNGENSTLGWFNNLFYPSVVQRGGGQGFTIVGEGYINFGVIGVILVFIFLGLFLKFLYVKSMTSIVWLVIYVTIIPLVIYINRADLANLFAQASKHIILPLIVIFALKHVVNGAVGKKDRLKTDP